MNKMKRGTVVSCALKTSCFKSFFLEIFNTIESNCCDNDDTLEYELKVSIDT